MKLRDCCDPQTYFIWAYDVIGSHASLRSSCLVRVSSSLTKPTKFLTEETMNYNRDLETDVQAKRDYDKRQKELASERLKRNADWNRQQKRSK